MKAQVTADDQFIRITEATAAEIDQLKLSFKRRIKNWRFHPKVKRGFWDGYINFINDALMIPAGLWAELRSVCERHSMPLEIEGMERVWDPTFDVEEFKAWVHDFYAKSPKPPREYQVEAAAQILRWKRSISEIATSAGKTKIIFTVMAYLKHRGLLRKMLVIVPNTNLVNQTILEFQDNCLECDNGFRFTSQRIMAGEERVQADVDLVIGTFHSLRKADPGFFSDFNVVCVDEAHHTNTTSIKGILVNCRDAGYRFGLSGTMMQDGFADALTVQAFLGPMAQKISPEFLFRNNYATPIFIKVVHLDYLSDELKEKISDYRRANRKTNGAQVLNLEKQVVVENRARLLFICDMIARTTKNTLVLFHNIKDGYGKQIYHTLREMTSHKIVYYVDGGTATDRRDEYKASLEEGDDKVLVASFGTFSQGISINNLHNIFFVESYKSEKIIKQSIGRGMRLCAGKSRVNIVDIVDDMSWRGDRCYHMKHAADRQKIYDQEGFKWKEYRVDLRGRGASLV